MSTLSSYTVPVIRCGDPRRRITTGPSGLLFGAGAIVVLPIFYGVLGFVFAGIGAAIYNLVAGWVGGIEIDMG